MRKTDVYVNDGGNDYIFNVKYDENADRIKIIVKTIHDNTEFKQFNLSDIAIRTILAIYQDIKFQMETLKEDSIYDKLDNMRDDLSEIRDNQKELNCKPDGCICSQFDLIIDELESLRDKFGSD